ncbi:DUF4282 domain-containing protein [Microbacterium sp. CFBP9034]|uniref:DUF4282 domain-containing protein n=1 Tax=Microbacterium sp. CFBP9034 TaxID=3096540 RepID=UPI002A6999AA|nr:DUF4282 domain-containing protein [Microbacterium sp. CFBP9034]MDY0909137.1 DUF4282 domain-containing protein [Microbacterium sp. CFBP9034]
MTDPTTPLPPLPEQPAAEAARAGGAPADATRPAYDPATDPDNTGVPSAPTSDAGAIGRGFFSALFDLSFRTFITRRLASVFYLVGLIAIGIGFLVYLVNGIVGGISLLWLNTGAGISAIIATIIIVPLVAFISIIALRFVIEAVVALIAIAENTERTAQHTRD